MKTEIVASDVTILDLLRKREQMTVAELSEAMGVTATATRQRLTRLMAQEFVGRKSQSEGRGRPVHRYYLTESGRRKTGENFAELAVALWQEVSEVDDPTIHRGLLQRLSHRMAEVFGRQIRGGTTRQRMDSLVEFYASRRIPLSVDEQSGSPVIKAHACPYPGLAERDRSLCAMEKMMFAEILERDIRLSECRLDGEACCAFEVRDSQDVAGAR